MACLQPELKIEIPGSDKIVSAACMYIQVTMRYMAIRDFASKDKEHLSLQRGDVRMPDNIHCTGREHKLTDPSSPFPVVSSPSLYAIDCVAARRRGDDDQSTVSARSHGRFTEDKNISARLSKLVKITSTISEHLVLALPSLSISGFSECCQKLGKFTVHAC